MSVEKDKSLWPPELDALTAAAQHHKLLFENESVRVLDTCIPPGEKTNIHTHQYPATLYIISWSDFIRYNAEGSVMVNSKALGLHYPAGSAAWSGALEPHSLENTGICNLHVISVEIKSKDHSQPI